jgi:hypothetical protein
MVQKGGYPFWGGDVPKGMSRDQYKILEKSKPKNKSMKVWIRENKKNMKKYTKKRSPKKKYTKERCKECRCKPCKCKEEIHCYKITCPTCNKKKRKRKKTRRRKKSTERSRQHGGLLPALGCIPCWAGPAIGAASLGTAGYMVSKSSSSKTVNGKTVYTRKETYKMKKKGKMIKKVYEQKNNRIYLNNKEIKPRPKDLEQATEQLNKRIKECIKSGFKKC